MPNVDLFGNPIDEPYGSWGPPDISGGVPAPSNPPGAMNPADYIHPVPGTTPTTGGEPNAAPSNPLAGYNATEQDWLRRNQNPNGSYDFHRLASALTNNTSNRVADSQDTTKYDTHGTYIGPPIAPVPPPNPNDPRVATSTPYNPTTSQAPPFQFTDPYTKLYEDVAQKNLASLQGQNPQMQQLMDFINKQFQTYTSSPGYSPEELAVLNTQMFSPIEANRQASQQRALERASARGILPSSGVVQDEQRLNDVNFDQLRAAGSRDVAINAIAKRQQDLNSALNLAQLGVQIPDQRNAEALSVANNLYQLPRTAMLDANSIVNGSSPTAALNPLIQLLQLGQQNSQFNQQQTTAQQQALQLQLGALLYNLLNGGQ